MLMPSPTPTQDMRAIRPARIAGFEIIRKLGQGTMGKVYLARQTHLDRLVALKILPDNIAKDQVFIERFQREARSSAKLNHSNIVQGIDGGLDEGTGKWYFAMEYVDGPSLGQVLKKERTLEERRALKIVRGIARGLAAAYKQNIVHRDIKPDNVILTRDGEPKLADLGLAQQVTEDSNLTQNGTAIGTPHYMAPEQATGELEKIDTRTDIYALGCTLYHLVTGRTPFSGRTSASIMTKHLMERPLPANLVNPLVSKECTMLIEKMMEKDQAKRFQDPFKLLKSLDRVCAGKSPFSKSKPKSATPSSGQVEAVQTASPVPSVPAPKPIMNGVRPKSGSKSRSLGRRPTSVKRKAKRRKGSFYRKPTVPSSAERPLRMSTSTTRAPRVEVKDNEPSQIKGFFLDLFVILALGGILSGGYFYFKIYGKDGVQGPPSTSVTVPIGNLEDAESSADAPILPILPEVVSPLNEADSHAEAAHPLTDAHPLSDRFVEPPPMANRKPVIVIQEQRGEVELPLNVEMESGHK